MRARAIFLLLFLAVCPLRSQVVTTSKIDPFIIGSKKLSCVAYGGDKFVAGGDGALIYSQGGASWHEAIGFFERFPYKSIAYGNGKFVAVGQSNFASSSTNGIRWFSSYLPSVSIDAEMKAVVFGGDRFVAFGTTGKYQFPAPDVIYSSSDGVNWTLVSTNKLTFLTYGAGRFLGLVEGTEFVISTNGIDWESFHADVPVLIDPQCSGSTCAEFDRFTGLSFQIYQFVATASWTVRNGGEVTARGSRLAVSENGRGWTYTKVSTPEWKNSDRNDLYCYNAWLYHLRRSGSLADPAILTSYYFATGGGPGGYLEFQDGDVDDVVWGDGTMVAVARESGKILRSFQGSAWVEVQEPNRRLVSIASNGSAVVAIGGAAYGSTEAQSMPTIMISTSNIPAFELVELPRGCPPLRKVIYAAGKFVAVGAGGTVLRSSDGLNWEERLSNTSSQLFDITYGNGLWVAVGANGRIITSTNTSVFYVADSRTDIELHGVAFGGGRFVAVGRDAAVLTSSDGKNWAGTGLDPALDLWSIAYGNGRFVAVGTNGFTQTSTNAIDWEFSATDAWNGLLGAVVFGDRYFVAPELGTNRFFASRDGHNWFAHRLVGSDSIVRNDSLVGCGSAGQTFWLVGDHSTIWTAEWSRDPVIKVISKIGQSGEAVLTLRSTGPGFAFDVGTYEIFAAADLVNPHWRSIWKYFNTPTDAIALQFPGTNSVFLQYTNAYFRAVRQTQ
jgi:hypothetical protein